MCNPFSTASKSRKKNWPDLYCGSGTSLDRIETLTMSTEIIQIEGECQLVIDESKRQVTSAQSELYVKTFAGDARRGKMVKFHIHQSDGADAEINMTIEQTNELIEALRSEISKIQIVVLNEHTMGYRYPSDNFINIFQSLIRKGANFDESQGRKYINTGDTVRMANAKDFEEFRIHMDGYKRDERYEFDRS